MGLPKGRTNNIKGKPKGTKSKKTIQWDALGESIMNEHTERFNSSLNDLDDDKFMDMYIKVLEYFKPKQNRTDITSGGEKINPPTIKFFDTNK